MSQRRIQPGCVSKNCLLATQWWWRVNIAETRSTVVKCKQYRKSERSWSVCMSSYVDRISHAKLRWTVSYHYFKISGTLVSLFQSRKAKVRHRPEVYTCRYSALTSTRIFPCCTRPIARFILTGHSVPALSIRMSHLGIRLKDTSLHITVREMSADQQLVPVANLGNITCLIVNVCLNMIWTDRNMLGIHGKVFTSTCVQWF